MNSTSRLAVFLLLTLSFGSAAAMAWGSGSQSEQLLDRDGDPLPKGAIARLGSKRATGENPIHKGFIQAVAFSPSGKHVASASYHHELGARLAVWQAKSGKLICQPNLEQQTYIREVFFSQDGNTLAGSDWHRFHYWDSYSGKPIDVLPATTTGGRGVAVRGAANLFAGLVELEERKPASTVIKREGVTEIRLWEFPYGKLYKRFGKKERPQAPLVFAPVGLRIASGGARLKEDSPKEEYSPRLLIWNGHGGDVVLELPVSDWVVALGFTTDGRKLISGTANGQIQVWDTHKGKELRQFKPEKSVSPGVIAISPDGKHVAMADGRSGEIVLWDAGTGVQIGCFAGDSSANVGFVRRMLFSPDGRLLATGGDDSTILIWQISDASQKR